MGKSHLLALLNAENMFVVKTLSPAKESLINIAEDLHKTGRLCPDGPDFETIKKQHTRTTIQGWTDMVLGSVKKNEFVLIVDDLSDMTASVGRLIDKLNRKFTIIAALPEVRKPYEKHFWKFDRIEIERLSTADAKKLIRQCTAGANIEDYRMTETNILQQSAGNPLKKAQTLQARLEMLHDKKLISDQQLENVRFDAEVAHYNWVATRMELDRTAIIAPQDGMVVEVNVKAGDWVLAYTAVAWIIDPMDLQVFMFVSEKRLNAIRMNMPLSAVPTAGGKRALPGRVIGISPVIDPENGTCKVTGLFLNAGNYVRPGALVNVTIGR